MTSIKKTIITVEATVHVPVEKVWKLWTDPKHIIHWNNASSDWHTPKAENDLRAGGRFLSRMEGVYRYHLFQKEMKRRLQKPLKLNKRTQ
ncbi:MAG: SRPBCC domain-containing protein [Bacteroidales bacterium]|nr:SRPBCC domain-containing protein [Bacteroidales bacterium]